MTITLAFFGSLANPSALWVRARPVDRALNTNPHAIPIRTLVTAFHAASAPYPCPHDIP
jgi:hypothetical protein